MYPHVDAECVSVAKDMETLLINPLIDKWIKRVIYDKCKYKCKQLIIKENEKSYHLYNMHGACNAGK